MNLDRKKIEKVKRSLMEKEGGSWTEVEGLQALTRVKSTDDDELTFMPSTGIVIKTFINDDTGELRVFPTALLKEDKKEDKDE